ncbi:MAG TPA: enoyl-[acyl-carrier-protein] reductase FabL [Thermoanaerobaculia bacterium]|nr:enoyl-[acyl-carrier-protein] reductase FabL [Thermoanaerobaculia bacterium]HUM29462.1 enoyl-[acyl-carrier-protein] reductase FabL [Thermoanaerobaculia bacterium]HXK67845.1 enoyl-[acyl-carrier-protein] reductase FabL [Thermoanaerobaculia bacterium]
MKRTFIDLSGKKALITGGSRGIGRSIAIALAEAGCDVAINFFRHREAAEEVAKEIEALGRTALILKANVAQEDHVHRMFEEMKSVWGQIDILVSNAASGVLKPITELTFHHWQWTMNINAASLLHLIQHSIPLMKEGGIVIAVSSLGAIRAIPNYTFVGASKAALESLVRHLTVELAPRGIRVNCISAGTVETDALRHFPNRDAILDESLERTPSGRLTTPEDVADVALFLCSPLASQIHGQTLIVDGGYSIVA